MQGVIQAGFWGHIGNFFYSNAFVGSVALLAAAVAFAVYDKQKRDSKRDAANIILLEIESAEQQLQIINQTQSENSLAENIYLMKNSSWDKLRYLFVRDFDRNEWDKVTDFYNNCLLYDIAIDSNKGYFATNVEKAQSEVMRVLADYSDEYLDDVMKAKTDKDKKELRLAYEAKKTDFINAYGVVQNEENYPLPFFYSPQKPIVEAKAILGRIETNLSLTSVGIKLKRLSNKNSLLRKLATTFGGSPKPNI